MNQRCTRNEKDNCRTKNVPVKLKTDTTTFIDIHQFTVSKDFAPNLNINFITSINVTSKVYFCIF